MQCVIVYATLFLQNEVESAMRECSTIQLMRVESSQDPFFPALEAKRGGDIYGSSIAGKPSAIIAKSITM